MSKDKNKGYIYLDRKILNNWLYNDKPFNMSMAWIDLLLIADHTTHTGLWRKTPTEFKRGDVNCSIAGLAERWGWSRNRTRRFLSHLEADGMVTVNATTNRTTISIVKYEDFQRRRATNEATNDTTDEATNDTTGVATGVATDEAHLITGINNNKGMKKKSPEPPWGGPDLGGPAPEGWTEEHEAGYQESRRITPSYKRMEWWNDWHEMFEKQEGDDHD